MTSSDVFGQSQWRLHKDWGKNICNYCISGKEKGRKRQKARTAAKGVKRQNFEGDTD